MPLANVAVIEVAVTAPPSTLKVIDPEGVGLGVGVGVGVGGVVVAVAVVVGDVGVLFPPPQAAAANNSVSVQGVTNRIPVLRGLYTPKLMYSQ
jgi:hypothetical protein